MKNLKPFSKERRLLRSKWNAENERTGISWDKYQQEQFKLLKTA